MSTIMQIPTYWAAAYKSYEVKDIARYLGAVYYQEYWAPEAPHRTHLFTHYFNTDGQEVLLCCNAMSNTIQIFNPPRLWGTKALAACEPRVYI